MRTLKATLGFLLIISLAGISWGASLLGAKGQGDYTGASWVGGSDSDHSVAEYEPGSGLWVNPAELAMKQKLNFGLRMIFEDTDTTDIKSSRITALGFSTRLPIGLDVGLMGSEEFDFSYVTAYEPLYLESQAEPIGRRRIDGSGKLYNVSLGAAVELDKGYYVGMAYNRYVGSAKTGFMNQYNSEEYSDSEDIVRDTLRGDSLTVGMMKKNSDKFIWGAAFRTTAKLDAETTLETGDGQETRSGDTEFQIPRSASIAGDWEVCPGWRIIPSLSYFWSADAKAPRSDVEFVNTAAFKITMDHAVEETKLWPSFQIPLRFSYEFRNWNYTDYDGSRIPVHTVTLGTSHQAKNRRIKLEGLYSQRGDSSHEPFNESVWQFRVSFQIGELQ